MSIEKTAFFHVAAAFGLSKAASMAMIRRFNEFNRLAGHSHPEIAAIGQKLVAQNARQIPKAFTPSAAPGAPVVQALAQKLSSIGPTMASGLMTPNVAAKAQSAVKKVTGQSTLKPGIKGPTGL